MRLKLAARHGRIIVGRRWNDDEERLVCALAAAIFSVLLPCSSTFDMDMFSAAELEILSRFVCHRRIPTSESIQLRCRQHRITSRPLLGHGCPSSAMPYS